ncbi:TetR/AcrR family transcriptional regulator [Methylonatrum kenyense]|uniref:TetR/AcrR family transcriptional regulator n=1 Tax=Methylonatrum kenyense TaxID=455253 RepID=UPI0020C08096|nr:TetR/AcrR family transcriptional regulator [Methylonatrum kenyense]MCK8516831.1 TetR/AcrR family transcriptional regulator [Methylonatrum kenyense]
MSTAVSGSDPLARRGAADRIVHAARTLFAERGYDGVSIRDVAERARVSKANVFHHFSNKMGLYKAVLGDSSDMFEEVVEVLRECGQPPRCRLELFIRENLALMLRDPHSVNLFMRQMMSTPDNAQRTLAEANVVEGFRKLIGNLENLQAEHRLAEDVDPTVLAMTIIGANFIFFRLRGVVDQISDRFRADDPAAFSAALIDLLDATTSRDHRPD